MVFWYLRHAWPKNYCQTYIINCYIGKQFSRERSLDVTRAEVRVFL
jgi:hypothetical protein